MANVHRRNTAIAASTLYFLSIPFLILVIIGNTHINSTLNDIYFFKLDVSQVIPISVDNSRLLNSVARSLGLHDFYQVGLWNFCEGYNDEGVTYCSNPKQWYWFNPVEILVSELLAGAQIALPAEAVTVLNLLKIGSRIMYGCFMAGICIDFVLIPLSLLVIRTRWWSLVITVLAFCTAILISLAAIIATVISVAAKVALTAQDQLNIRANIGIKMFVFMWLAAIFTDVAFLLHAAMGCCCRPNRDEPQCLQGEMRAAHPNLRHRRRHRSSSHSS
ncbi:SUR7/PalI family-domain-containing protein [Fusarium redolens]|uniref:SUR7/PalI family-domain-containing protein n=1 Tax=Fusarium redolens TaxID=48865 RepID=A0A9P9KFT4_FUSRE|nr:SUR7/PalI family-domain-containing protein [Fusarium redolens]KAH7255615.1 SUR7/PalI family-domain-containing protein [Fusarium redolens]